MVLKKNEMFAVIKTGGQQFKVRQNDVIRVQKIDSLVDETVNIEHVLMVHNGSDLRIGKECINSKWKVL